MPDLENAPFLQDDIVQKGFAIAKMAGGEGRLVGGIVRDYLLGRPLGDLDMAVNVPITEFAATAQKEGLRIIETGLSHGSVTLHYQGANLEVTQTRADLKTDGRHALIGFTPCFTEDAKRRDFTINALYLDEAGRLHDPLDGQADISAKQLRFIGDASQRITEDYLRILRFLRFGAQLDGFSCDAGQLEQISSHLAGLKSVSGERIITELQKLFAGAQWHKMVPFFQETGLDEALFGTAFLPLSAHYQRLISWQSRLASCLDEAGIDKALALPFSRADGAMIRYLMTGLSAQEFTMLKSAQWREVAHFGGVDFYHRLLVQLRHHASDLPDARLDEMRHFVPPPCPVTGHDLQQAGIARGPEIGAMLRAAERLYVQSDYQLDAKQILRQILARFDAKSATETSQKS